MIYRNEKGELCWKATPLKTEKTPGVSPASHSARLYRERKQAEQQLAEAYGEEYF